MSHLLLAAVRDFAVHLSGRWVIGVDEIPTGDELSPDVVLQSQE